MNIFFGKRKFRKIADFQIIPSEPRHIFYDNRFHFSFVYVGHHSLKIRTIEIRSAVTVVDIIFNISVSVLFRIPSENIPLIFDTVAFALGTVIVYTEPAIKRGYSVTSSVFCSFIFICRL